MVLIKRNIFIVFLATSIMVCGFNTPTLAAANPTGHITYVLSTDNSATQAGKEAYARIKIAMDSALYYYNTYTTITKKLVIRFDASVGTAEANFDGRISFGGNKAYQITCTAMHEIAHAIGVGTTNEWKRLMVNGVFTGKNATRKIQEIFNSPDSIIHGDTNRERLWHFWPFGLNYASEVKSKQDLINHCLIVDAIDKDLFPTAATILYKELRTGAVSVEVTSGVTPTFQIHSSSKVDMALFNLNGVKVCGTVPQLYSPGKHISPLELSNLPSGRYIYRVTAGATFAEAVFSVRH